MTAVRASRRRGPRDGGAPGRRRAAAAPGLLLAAALALTACRGACRPAPPPPPRPAAAVAPAPRAGAWTRTELFFGMQRRDGRPVTEEEWARFVEDTVAREFPAGSTVMHAEGRYRHASGEVVREASRVLVLFSEDARAAAADEAIRRVVSRYLEAFDQESVLRSETRADVTFLDRAALAPSRARPASPVPAPAGAVAR